MLTTGSNKDLQSQPEFGYLIAPNEVGVAQDVFYVYVQGIPQFDEILGTEKSFERFMHCDIVAYEKAFAFVLSKGPKEIISLVGFSRETIMGFSEVAKEDLAFPDYSKITTALRSTPGGSLIHFAFRGLGALADKARGMKTKTMPGVEFTLRHRNEHRDEERIIFYARNDKKAAKAFRESLATFFVSELKSEHQKPSSGGCYVATAVYGSHDAKQVLAFRAFRDEKLMTTSFGRAAVRAYYAVSPKLSRHFRKGFFRNLAKSVFDKIYHKLTNGK